ncbi:hypothetical protein BOTNAR_0051g00110 [Botryotinia narcissicola]|uniref:Uncharacterized protein n=1 Tax=Botryotinia narcissicola TaxID=278944 RepID=A0A4Z1IZV0_9HELO|nr:hypothetical protein BOTNAR_0051g00110 [Botryotinia narcissicola]
MIASKTPTPHHHQDMQSPSTQSFMPNPRHTLTDTHIRRPRNTSNPELQFPIPGALTQEESNPKSQFGNRDSYFIPRRRCEDREIDLKGQYPRTQTPRNHLEYNLDSSFGDRYCRISNIHDQNSISHFENRTNESRSPYLSTQEAHQNINPEPTSASTQRVRRRSHSENGSSQAEPY